MLKSFKNGIKKKLRKALGIKELEDSIKRLHNSISHESPQPLESDNITSLLIELINSSKAGSVFTCQINNMDLLAPVEILHLCPHCIHPQPDQKLTYFVETRQSDWLCSHLKLFYSKRIFRIFPLIIVFLALSTFLNFFKTFCTVPWDVFISDALSILGSYLINHKSHGIYYNGAMWSLTVEMQFYLIFPVLLILFYKIRNNSLKGINIILISTYLAIAALLRTIIAYSDVLNFKLTGFLYHIAQWKFDFLILGIMVYFLNLNLPINSKKALKLTAFLLLLFPLILSYQLGAGLSLATQEKLLYTLGYLVFGLCFFGVLKIASLDKDLFTIHPFIDRFVEYLGSRSYSIYVLHFPALVIVWMIINHFFSSIFYINPIYYGLAQAVIFMLVGIPLAEISFRYIEQPAISMGEFIINKYQIDKK
jgi:peptidoglycan/LPS O-acetylase OafA/YrhL